MSVSGPFLLSSSPPRLFAQSPTPVANPFSSPRSHFLGDILASQPTQVSVDLPSQANEKVRFESSNKTRAGFGTSSGHTKTTPNLLRGAIGGENLPIQKKSTGLKKPAKSSKKPVVANGGRLSAGRGEIWDVEFGDASPKRDYDGSRPEKAIILEDCLNPIGLEKATSRRRDWTPPSSPDASGDDSTVAVRPALGNFQSFLHKAASQVSRDELGREGSSSKRQKLDTKEAAITPSKPKLMRVQPIKGKKSAKSTLTITGLMTSKYSVDPEQESLMRQFLSATQQESQDAVDDDTQDLLNAAIKQKSARQVVKRKGARNQTVQSPKSALAAFDGQDPLFGSASQLAREESPSLIRDTIEAMRQSEQTSFVSAARPSSPITIPTSEPSETPKQRQEKRGISRFVKSRNLWSAAGRDEDNALLQVDTIDLYDSPDIRRALAGKDVLLEPIGPKSGKNTQSKPLLMVRDVINIDDYTIPTPCVSRRRSPDRNPDPAPTVMSAKTHSKSQDGPPKLSRTTSGPAKPIYGGFTDNQLASQLRSYGFKPIKNRLKMIDTLNKCWDNQHQYGTNNTANEKQDASTSNADSLAGVHDILSRPVPKVKKPRATKRKSSNEAGAGNKKPSGTGEVKGARGRKRKSDELAAASKGPPARPTSSGMGSMPRTKPTAATAAASNIASKAVDTDQNKTKTDIRPSSKSATELAPIPPPAILQPTSQPLLEAPPFSPSKTAPPILTAILSQPHHPTNPASNPTFHQLLLSYSPIALEELTVWLNTTGLGGVGWDGEVGIGEVKEWCEGKGLVCYFERDGWRKGRGEKRGE